MKDTLLKEIKTLCSNVSTDQFTEQFEEIFRSILSLEVGKGTIYLMKGKTDSSYVDLWSKTYLEDLRGLLISLSPDNKSAIKAFSLV